MRRLLAFLATTLLVYSPSATSTSTGTTSESAAPSNNTPLDWPYSVTLVNDTNLVEQCSKVSGFRFRTNSLPNAQQISLMCAEPSCGNITTRLIKQRTDRASFTAAYDSFAVPMLDFCWFMREPGAPCPENKVADFLSHKEILEKDANCARTTNYSILSPDRLVVPPNGFPNLTCSPDCVPLTHRMFWLLTYMPCPDGNRPNKERSWMLTTGVICKASDWSRYQYTPGWPLPPVPEPEPAPTSPASSGSDASSASTSEDTPLPPEVGSIEAGGSGSFDNTPRSRKPTTRPDTKTQSEQASRSAEPQDVLGTATSTVQGVAATTTTTPRKPQASNPRQDESTTSPPAGQAATGLTSRQDYAPFGVAGAVCVLLAVVIYAMSARRKQTSTKAYDDDHSSTYWTLDRPSSDGQTGELLTGANGGTATIQKVIATKHIQDVRIIGSGGFGVAYLVKDVINDRLLASKRLVPNSITSDAIDKFFQEIQLVSTLQHPRIVTFVGATWTNRVDIQALFEYMDGGDLRTYLDVTPVTTKWSREKLTIAIDVADALVYVHTELSTPLVHRDLKSRNILLAKSPLRSKLSDFGVARPVTQNESMTNGVGTSRWLAPEVIVGRGDYGTACDVYSFGVVLSELDTHEIPFSDCGRDLGLNSILPEIAIMRMVALEGRRPSFSGTCPPKILDLARQCMAHDPSERPSAVAVASALCEIAVGGDERQCSGRSSVEMISNLLD